MTASYFTTVFAQSVLLQNKHVLSFVLSDIICLVIISQVQHFKQRVSGSSWRLQQIRFMSMKENTD